MLIDPLFTHARNTPQDIGVVDDLGQYTYGQIAGLAAGLSALISNTTTRPHVGIMLPAGVGFVSSFYGTLLARKVAVLINFLLGDREVQHVLSDSGIDTVITIPQLAPRVAGQANLRVIDLADVLKQFAGASAASGASNASEASGASGASGSSGLSADVLSRLAPPKKTEDDLAVIMYTSGTSGLPKGVMLTYGNLQSNVDGCINCAILRHQHVFLGVIPLFHAFGLTAMMLAPIQLAARAVYIARFSPVGAVNAIKTHRASIFMGVPSMFGALLNLKNATADDFSNVELIISGAEPLPATVREAFFARYGKRLLEGYGLTETSPAVALNSSAEFREGSVGKLLSGAEVRITDDNGNALPAGQPGDIHVRGPMVMKGYYNLPEVTADAMTRDGYFKTGDIGHFDADGFLYITGRRKELIIVAGEKAAPREIEDVLLQHPAVKEAAVVGKKDPGRGEVVVAFVTLNEGHGATPEDLRKFCTTFGLVAWKVPRQITILQDLPRSPTGKVLKRVLGEQANA